MRRLSYLIDGKADEHFERAFHLFGSDDPGGDSGGGAGEDIVTMARARLTGRQCQRAKKWP